MRKFKQFDIDAGCEVDYIEVLANIIVIDNKPRIIKNIGNCLYFTLEFYLLKKRYVLIGWIIEEVMPFMDALPIVNDNIYLICKSVKFKDESSILNTSWTVSEINGNINPTLLKGIFLGKPSSIELLSIPYISKLEEMPKLKEIPIKINTPQFKINPIESKYTLFANSLKESNISGSELPPVIKRKKKEVTLEKKSNNGCLNFILIFIGVSIIWGIVGSLGSERNFIEAVFRSWDTLLKIAGWASFVYIFYLIGRSDK